MVFDFPRFEARMPELVHFTGALAGDYQSGRLADKARLDHAVKAFFTPERMAQIEILVPGWGKMAGYNLGATLTHVTSVFIAFFDSPERRQMTSSQQSLVLWMILFHDTGKEIQPKRRDNLHAFRSAAIAAKALPALGFATLPDYPSHIQDWVDLVENAVTVDAVGQAVIQDNRKLPAILEGLEALYGKNTPPFYLVKAVLLHLSVTTVIDWPPSAPLSDDELKGAIDLEFMPYLESLMLADSDAWALFEEDLKERQRQEVLAAFRRIRELP